jgi:CRISPR-associated protein Csm4
MKTYAVYLKPKSSFMTWPSSDTIFGALCWAIYHVHGQSGLENILKHFNDKPKFILSSAFPYLQGNGVIVRFFLKPLFPELKSQEVEELAKKEIKGRGSDKTLDFKQKVILISERLKEIKKASYVSEMLFKQLVDGSLKSKVIFSRLKHRGTSDSDIEKLGNCLITFGEREKVDPDGELKTLIREVDVQRNQIDRVAGSTVEGLLFFNKEFCLPKARGGLWFLVKTDDFEYMKPLFRYLEDTGIGGERTVGKGHFEIFWDENPYTLPKAKDANVFVTLSRYFPSEDERSFNEGFASWNIMNWRQRRESMYAPKGNFISNDLLRMFSEGSVFPFKERKEYYGKIESVEFSGANPVYRNGLAFPVFTRIGG